MGAGSSAPLPLPGVAGYERLAPLPNGYRLLAQGAGPGGLNLRGSFLANGAVCVKKIGGRAFAYACVVDNALLPLTAAQ